ncbi:hypothetical protein CEXT_453691 [Caerostris extrusa]|uniref:Uncharacterized protein n=1 Tax=Caerostris extrusa TaxID=172846 RepID=A0AAV4TGY8_CAEEX|nr:hypothetical protein CEXT_453691 [Caerostris extrusa]
MPKKKKRTNLISNISSLQKCFWKNHIPCISTAIAYHRLHLPEREAERERKGVRSVKEQEALGLTSAVDRPRDPDIRCSTMGSSHRDPNSTNTMPPSPPPPFLRQRPLRRRRPSSHFRKTNSIFLNFTLLPSLNNQYNSCSEMDVFPS